MQIPSQPTHTGSTPIWSQFNSQDKSQDQDGDHVGQADQPGAALVKFAGLHIPGFPGAPETAFQEKELGNDQIPQDCCDTHGNPYLRNRRMTTFKSTVNIMDRMIVLASGKYTSQFLPPK